MSSPFTVSSTTSGCACETGIPVPMSSGGSTATASGLRHATAFEVSILLVHTHDSISNSLCLAKPCFSRIYSFPSK